MRWEERNSKIEERVDDMVDDIAEEFDLVIPFYPETYWVGKKLNFGDLHLPKNCFRSFQDAKENKSGLNYCSHNMILVGRESDHLIGEEAAHFLYHQNSGVKQWGREYPDILGIKIYHEMLGFFGSKLADSSRKYEPERTDWIISKNLDTDALSQIKKIMESKDIDTHYNFIYDMGYGLGEKLFNHYISEKVSKKFVRDLFCDPLEKFGYPIWKFLNLKYKELK